MNFLFIMAGVSLVLCGYGLGWIDGRHDLRRDYEALGRIVQRHEDHEVKN